MVKKDQEWRLLNKAYRLVDAKHEYALGMKGAMRWLLDKSSSGDLELRHEGDPTGEQVRYLLTEYAADPGIGRVAELVGIRRRGPSPAWLVRSGGEVKLARGLGEALPAGDL